MVVGDGVGANVFGFAGSQYDQGSLLNWSHPVTHGAFAAMHHEAWGSAGCEVPSTGGTTRSAHMNLAPLPVAAAGVSCITIDSPAAIAAGVGCHIVVASPVHVVPVQVRMGQFSLTASAGPDALYM